MCSVQVTQGDMGLHLSSQQVISLVEGDVDFHMAS